MSLDAIEDEGRLTALQGALSARLSNACELSGAMTLASLDEIEVLASQCLLLTSRLKDLLQKNTSA
jgi:hypothetical protein